MAALRAILHNIAAAAMLASLVILACIGQALADPDTISQKRVALVIGNAGYSAGSLRNPSNDAADVAAALRRLGFQVRVGTDLTLVGFGKILGEYASDVRDADVSLIYYSGHATQIDGVNWLMPVDTDLSSTFMFKRSNVTLQEVIDVARRGAKTSLVFLDACRNNPLADRMKAEQGSSTRSIAETRGLARVAVEAPDMLVVYATQPDAVALDGTGRNSPFTEAFLENVNAPGVEIETLMKRISVSVSQKTNQQQEPERLSRLRSEFYFVPQGTPPPAALAAGPAPATESVPLQPAPTPAPAPSPPPAAPATQLAALPPAEAEPSSVAGPPFASDDLAARHNDLVEAWPGFAELRRLRPKEYDAALANVPVSAGVTDVNNGFTVVSNAMTAAIKADIGSFRKLDDRQTSELLKAYGALLRHVDSELGPEFCGRLVQNDIASYSNTQFLAQNLPKLVELLKRTNSLQVAILGAYERAKGNKLRSAASNLDFAPYAADLTAIATARNGRQFDRICGATTTFIDKLLVVGGRGGERLRIAAFMALQ